MTSHLPMETTRIERGNLVIEGIPELIQIVKELVPTTALEATVDKLKIIEAALGGNAGAIGAATLAQKLVSNFRYPVF